MKDGRKIALAALTLVAVGLVPSEVLSEDARAAATAYSSSIAITGTEGRRGSIGISANPAALEVTTGTGWLGRQLGLKEGWALGGVAVGTGNTLLTGGIEPGATANGQLIVNLHGDLERLHGLKGSSVGAMFMQLSNDPTNGNAGTILGFNSLDSTEPTNRSELVQLWWRQALFDERLVVRVGKVNPGSDFANIVRPITTTAAGRDIGVVTSLLYGPVYTLGTFYGVFPGFYETPFGITTTWAPNENIYAAYGVYDGNLARGVPVGIHWPEFNGYYFHIAEAGLNWLWGPEAKPGNIGVGAYGQTGKLSLDNGITENGMSGLYAYGSQQLWYRDPEPVDNAGISAFFQFGWNDSKTRLFELFVGAGLTFRGLVEPRPKDSFGVGLAWGQLNPNIFETKNDVVLQGYYQAHVVGTVYTETALSYIPEPGAEPGIAPTWALTQQFSVAF